MRYDIPGEPKTEIYLARLEPIRRLKQNWFDSNPVLQSGHEWQRTSSVWTQHNAAKSIGKKPDAPGQLGYQLYGELSGSGSCASSVVGFGPCPGDQSLVGDHMSTHLKYIALPEV